LWTCLRKDSRKILLEAPDIECRVQTHLGWDIKLVRVADYVDDCEWADESRE
jgi:hypothetical protein